MTETLRAIVGARVSVMKGEEKVSHLAQHETGVKHAERQGWTVVDTFEDLSVSADKVDPFNRPDLKPWLAEDRSEDWDVMIFAKIDRAFRSTRDCVYFAEWMKERGKILVFADDGLTLNYRDKSKDNIESMMAELFVYLGSFFAQIELNRFKSRALDAHSVLKRQDRWAGGVAPEGFKTAPHPSGKGRTIKTDPDRKAMLHQMAKKLLEGESYNGIALWLSAQGYLTNRDYQRQPEKRQGTQWSTIEVKRALSSLRTQGIKMEGQGKNNKPILDDEGNQIQIAQPTFNEEEWEAIQKVISKRDREPYRKNAESPLYGVLKCGVCGRNLSQNIHTKGERVHRYYRCGKLPKACPGIRMRAEAIENILEEEFLEEVGNVNRTIRTYVKGEDHSEELEVVRRTIDSLSEDRAMGLIVSEEDEKRYRKQMKTLIDKRTELESSPGRKSGWVHDDTGETFGQAWEKADTAQRRELLLNSGVTFTLLNGSKNEYRMHVPEDIKQKVTGEK